MPATEDRNLSITSILIRPLLPGDNAALAKIIRAALKEFGADKPGTVYYDETTDHLYELFQQPGARYFVAEYEGGILGGGGIFPTNGLPTDTCELVKMYLAPEARGIGLGRLLIQTCIDAAIQSGYKNIYLETMPELEQALHTYAKFGFTHLQAPMGNSGHFGCGKWMLKAL